MFARERLSGYYGALPYTLASTAASLPFLAIIACTCMALLSLLADFSLTVGRFPFAVLNLTLALTTVRTRRVSDAVLLLMIFHMRQSAVRCKHRGPRVIAIAALS